MTTQSISDEEAAVAETIKETAQEVEQVAEVASVECENTHEEEVIKNGAVNAEFTSTTRAKAKLRPKNVHFKPKVGTLHLLHTARKNAKFASELNLPCFSERRKARLAKFQNKRQRKENASIYFHCRIKRKAKDEHS